MGIWMVIAVILAALFGIFAGFINSRISKQALKKESTYAVIGVNAIRFVVDVASMAVVFAVCRLSEIPFAAPLIACVIGLTAGGMFFLHRVTKLPAKQDENAKISPFDLLKSGDGKDDRS